MSLAPQLSQTDDFQTRPPSHSPPDVEYVPGQKLSALLGWFSIGLGVAEMVTPELIEDATGVRGTKLIRAYGVREFAAGVGILTASRPTFWLWTRVAGDALDLGTLAVPLRSWNPRRRRRACVAAAAVAGVTILDIACAASQSAAAKLTNSPRSRRGART